MLIAEDEAIIAIELEIILGDLGAEVVGVAGRGEDALRLAEALRPDFATMDVRLDGALDGIDTAMEMLRRHGIRSLFVTAYTEPSIVERAQGANPIGWVRKPFHSHSILMALESFLPARA